MTLTRLFALSLVGCTGADPTDDTAVDTAPVVDTADTADLVPEPVWTAWPVGSSSTLNGVYASGSGVYVAGTGAGVYVGGASSTWTPLETGLSDDEDYGDMWGQGADATLDLCLVATSGNVARFTGGAWVIEDLGTSNHEGIGGSSPDALYAVSWGGIYRWNGAVWSFEAPPSDERLNDVLGVGEEAIAVGEGGAIVHRDTDGAWSVVESGVSADLHGIAGVAINDVWAVGAEGTAIHFDGSAWTAVDTGVEEALWAVFAPSSTAVYAVGNNGVALVWNGTEWSSLPTGVTNNLYAVHGASDSNVWAVGNRGSAIQYKVN